MVTRGDVEYEGSIEIPQDLVEAAGIWPGEKVLVASITSLLFIFVYITFLKGYSNKKDDVILPGYCKIAKILCPILFVLAAVLGVFGG